MLRWPRIFSCDFIDKQAKIVTSRHYNFTGIVSNGLARDSHLLALLRCWTRSLICVRQGFVCHTENPPATNAGG